MAILLEALEDEMIRDPGDPSSDPDTQEALSKKYSDGRWTVPLSSGRIAVFAHPAGSKFYGICDTWEEAASFHIPSFADPHSIQRERKVVDKVSLEDLGL